MLIQRSPSTTATWRSSEAAAARQRGQELSRVERGDGRGEALLLLLSGNGNGENREQGKSLWESKSRIWNLTMKATHGLGGLRRPIHPDLQTNMTKQV